MPSRVTLSDVPVTICVRVPSGVATVIIDGTCVRYMYGPDDTFDPVCRIGQEGFREYLSHALRVGD